MGKKQISQLTFFHYVTGITIGSIAADIAGQEETPFCGWPHCNDLVGGINDIHEPCRAQVKKSTRHLGRPADNCHSLKGRSLRRL